MHLVLRGKLLLDPEQRAALLATVVRINEAANWLGERAFADTCSNKILLQRNHYAALRSRFGISAQMAIRTIAKVTDAYKRDRSIQPTFRPHGAVAYDARLYSFKAGCETISFSTLGGRIVARLRWRDADLARLRTSKRGEADVLVTSDDVYLLVTIEVTEAELLSTTGTLGVDLGIVNIATDSDGEKHSGAEMLATRYRNQQLRSALQSAGTRSAKRHLHRLAGREKRFASHTNHVISKSLVRKAQGTGRALALEDLEGIRDRVTVRRQQRSGLHSWSFRQLRMFLSYKAALAGVPLRLVDPRNTSRTCPECGHCDKASRRNQAEFVCTGCGFAEHADVVGARNIAARAEVDRPIVANCEVVESHGVQLQSLAL